MSDLPEGWVATRLGQLLKSIVGGGTPSKANPAYFQGSIPFMTVKDLHARFVADTQDHISDAALEDSASTLVPADTLIVATRMSLGKITRPLVPTAINQDLKALFLREGVDKTYVEHLWRANEARIQGMGTGTTVKGIRLEDIRGLDVPLAPTAEQTRIANQLDTLLTRIQSCNDRFDAIPALLKRFRRAVFSAGTTGALTADWRGADSTESWDTCTIGQVLNGKPRNGYSPQAADYETPIRSLTLSATTTGKFLARHSKFIDEAIPEDSYLWLEPGDILIQRANSLEHVGVSAIFDGDAKQFIYPDLMMRCRPNERIKSKYLFYALSAESTRDYFRKNATGTAGNMPKINQQTVMSAPLLLPPMDEQTEIVRRVEALFALADRIEARTTAARTQAQRLSPLVLAKAFRGELVQQDPQDEPASALLDRFASQRIEPAAKKQSKPPRQVRAPRAPKEAAAVIKSRQDKDVNGKPYLADHLRRLGSPTTAEVLFKASELPIADFYKQLAWEVAQGHIADGGTTLEARHAVG
jgi:type I restriction enzyme, S subunit